MTTRDGLEYALEADWSLANLEVYGDFLQQEGDPRGELITIDVHAAREGWTDELRARRTAGFERWLGEHASLLDPQAEVRFGYGFVASATARSLRQVLASNAAPFLRRLRLQGLVKNITPMLVELCEQPRRWLSSLHLGSIAVKRDQPLPVFDDALATALLDRLPYLSHLTIEGDEVFRALPHGYLRRIHAVGHKPIRTFVEAGPAFPALTELVYEPPLFAKHFGANGLTGLLPAASFPALRSLDLASREPRWASRDPQVSVFMVLRMVGVLPQLGHLRITEITDAEEAELLQQSLDQMPDLERLEILGDGRFVDGLKHPQAAIVVQPAPWQVLGSGTLHIGFSTKKVLGDFADGMSGLVRPLFRELVRRFHTYPEAVHEAWARVFAAASDGVNATTELPRAVLQVALDALDDDPQDPDLEAVFGDWRKLRKRLRAETGTVVYVDFVPGKR